MERETDKHSPRIDEAMAGDAGSLLRGNGAGESRAQEARLQEEDPEVSPGTRPGSDEAVGLGISAADADRRAELARHLALAHFPARREELVGAAEEDFAPPDLVEALRALPPDEEYGNVQAVWAAMGGATEAEHS